jgi:energy-coupling factor transporter ATP-binding protein EcfA2
MIATDIRPILTELRLSAFKSHRGAEFTFDPVTVVSGSSGSGKSSVLEALGVLARLACGDGLGEVFSAVRGGASGCVPQGARPDAEGRRGMRIGCTVDGPVGPVRLDLAVQAEPELRIVGERLTGAGEVLLSTALRDPARRTVQAAWHTAGLAPVTRAPLPDDRLVTGLLPLRVAGKTAGQRLVLAAAEQVLVALRAVFCVDPQPQRMRSPVGVGDGMLRAGCENLSAVLHRTQGECRTRHAALVAAMRAACDGPVEGLTVMRRVLARSGGDAAQEAVLAAVDRGPLLGLTPVDRLGDGELRFLAIALVLLTGPGVLEMDQSAEVLPARRAMTVVADGLDCGLDTAQTRELLSLAVCAAGRGHVRLVGAVHDARQVVVEGSDGLSVIEVGRGNGVGVLRKRLPGRGAERMPGQGTRRESAGVGGE